MKKIILLLALLCSFPLVFAQEEEYGFLVSFTYDLNSDSFSFDSVRIIERGEMSFEQGSEEGYSLKVFSGTEEYEIKFKTTHTIYVDPPRDELFDENGEQKYFPEIDEVIQVMEQTQQVMFLPYMDNARMRIIDEEGNEKLEIDLQEKIEEEFSEFPQDEEVEEKEEIKLNELALLIATLGLIFILYVFIKKRIPLARV